MLTNRELRNQANWLDRLISYFAPRAGHQRLRFRAANKMLLKRKYEGASHGRRTEGWRTTFGDANTELISAIRTLRNRSRDLVRNNPWATQGVRVVESNVVGVGILGKIIVKGRSSKRRETTLNQMWNAWIRNPGVFDWGGEQTFHGMQSLALRSCIEGGESFVRLRQVRRQFARDQFGEIVEVPPIQLQLLEAEFLDTSRLIDFNTDGTVKIVQGIEISIKTGKRIAYHMFESHPGALDGIPAERFRTVKIPAEFVSHIFRKDRAGQLRGVPWLSNVIIRLRDFDEYEDAQLVRQKIAAMFVGFIEDQDGIDESESEEKCVLPDTMEPGTMPVLPPGKKITLSKPPDVEGYAEYTSVNLHGIAAGLGITYEELTGDLSQVNFSSARMGRLSMNRNVKSWRTLTFEPTYLNKVWDWFMQGVELLGIDTNGASIEWTAPRQEMVDPTKETPALIKAIRGGIKTLPEAIRESGRDPDKVLQEIADSNKQLDGLQLILDSDPRKTAAAGVIQAEDEETDPPQRPNED